MRSTVVRLQRRTGVCTRWLTAGYGFVKDDVDKTDIFVHRSAISVSNEKNKALRVGETVEFEIAERDGRKEGVAITGRGGIPVDDLDPVHNCRSPVSCYVCGLEGHISRDCTRPRLERWHERRGRGRGGRGGSRPPSNFVCARPGGFTFREKEA